MSTPPPPPPGSEQTNYTITNADIDGNGEVKYNLDQFAEKDNPNYLTIFNTSTQPITLLEISNLGGNDGEPDTVRIDLSQFSGNFAIELKNTGDTVQDSLVLEGVHEVSDNGDGTFSVSYFGSDGLMRFVQVTPDNAVLDVYYAPDGIFDGSDGADVIEVGDSDLQGDSIDGGDGDADVIRGNAGSDSITGGAGDDTIFGDYQSEGGLVTPGLPDGVNFGTPEDPAPGAEVDTRTLTNTLINNGQAKIEIDSFADKDNANDVTVLDGGSEALTELIVEKGGDSDGQVDVIRLDLSGYNDDFTLEFKNEEAQDKIVLTNVHTIKDNGDGTQTVQYFGSDGLAHTLTILPTDAQVEAWVTEDSPYFFNDTIDGGAGSDEIDGGFGEDSIDGGLGDDTLVGNVGRDTISGGEGNDAIFGDFQADVVTAGVPGTPDLIVDGTDFVRSNGVYNADIETVAPPGAANHILFVDNGTFNNVSEIDVSKFDAAGEEDIIQFDLSTFDDDFVINVASQGEANDKIYLDGVNTADYDSVNEVWNVTYFGSDGALHYVSLDPGDAQVETFSATAMETEFVGDADVLTGDAGDDTIKGGFGADTIDGGADNDELDGGRGNDDISGGDGQDTIYGGRGASSSVALERVAFKWSDIPDPDDGGSIDEDDEITSGTQTVNGVDVTYSSSNSNVSFSDDSMATAGIDAGSGSVNPNSSASFDNTSLVELDFSQSVQNVQFRVNDFESNNELMEIRAYDADGNLIPFNVTPGSNISGTDTDGVAGDDLFQGSDPSSNDTNLDNSILISIPGPVSRIEMDMTSFNNFTLSVTDVYFDDPSTGSAAEGDDRMFGNDGDDTFIAGRGNDTIDGGAGTDTYDAETNPELDDETITVILDGNGDGTSTKANDGTVDDLTSIERVIAGEAASEADVITLTDGVLSTDVSNISDNAIGTFTSDEDGQTYNFGGPGEPTINEILAGTFDPGTGRIWPNGSYQITSGEEDGADVGDTYFENFETANFEVVCFARGTLIRTPSGEVPIERLAAGDAVETLDSGDQNIRWIGKTTVPARGKHAPIRFAPGAIGNADALLVSPQHRVLLSGWQAELYFGQSEVLVPAKTLVNETTIDVCPADKVEYFHMLFDRHEIVFSNGVPTESLHPGHVAMNAIGQAARDEVLELFPELSSTTLAHGPIARPALRAFEGKLMSLENA